MKKKVNKLKVFIFVFFILGILFAFFNRQISFFNSKLLLFTGETKFYVETKSKALVSQPEPLAPKKQPKPKIDYNRRVTTKKTLTPVPEIRLVPRMIDSEYENINPFPALRLYTGDEWDKEKTDIIGLTDGQELALYIYCHDSNPDDIVKDFSIVEGEGSSYKDDSVEIFLMKNVGAKEYFHYAVSASGKHSVSKYMINPNDPRVGRKQKKLPVDLVDPLVQVEEKKDGFFVQIKISLSNIDIEDTNIQDGFLIQIVRNYRGSKKTDECATLQLFPVYIYGDNRFGASNHHNRAFQQIRIVK